MKVSIPDTVMVNELGREGVLLDLSNGEYFSLDEVGMDMWKALAKLGSTEAACAELSTVYAVDGPTLKNDLESFAEKLSSCKLVTLTSGD
jgi:hypothetical protein